MIMPTATATEWVISVILVLASLLILFARKPVYAGLSFLIVLLMLSALYLQLETQFIAIMQILVYAGAILVIFMFVIILFQDAYLQIEGVPAVSSSTLLYAAGGLLVFALCCVGFTMSSLNEPAKDVVEGFGSVEALGKALYVDFFFPFEAVILLFLVALAGSLYIAKTIIPTRAALIDEEGK